MAVVKRIKTGFTETGITAYCIVRREADGYLLNDADGSFSAAPADPYLSLTEHGTIKGLYEVSESRQSWNNGEYMVTGYKQSGGSEAPVSDNIIGNGEIYIINDTEVEEGEYLEAIRNRVEENAFQGGAVWIDDVNGTAGTARPIGTALKPSSNWTDAFSILGTEKANIVMVKGAITIGSGDDISGMIFIANGDHAAITLTSGCTTVNTVFRGHIHLSGAVGGHIHCHGTHYDSNLSGFNGFSENCLYDAINITLNGSGLARIINGSASGAPGSAVTITAGSGITLGVYGFTGKLEIDNKTGSEIFDIELTSGELEITSGCTAGKINVRGMGTVTDNSGAGCNVIKGGLVVQEIDSVLSTTHGSGTWDVTAIASDITILKKIATGRWQITGNQMILYDSDKTTPLYTFNLLDALGAATMRNPMERTPV